MTLEELYQAIDDYIEFYNHERFQKRLNYFSPVQYKEAMSVSTWQGWDHDGHAFAPLLLLYSLVRLLAKAQSILHYR